MKLILIAIMACALLAGCRSTAEVAEPAVAAPATDGTVANVEQTDAAVTVKPLRDTTMDNLADAVVAVSLGDNAIYADAEGVLQMDVKIYTYDRYDMVDISALKVGDILVSYAGETEVISLEQTGNGTVRINGGPEEGGVDLVTDDSGVYFEMGFNDVKSWYKAGEATIRVADDFKVQDSSSLERDPLVYTADVFMNEEFEENYFNPYNTTIRFENSQVVELNCTYVP